MLLLLTDRNAQHFLLFPKALSETSALLAILHEPECIFLGVSASRFVSCDSSLAIRKEFFSMIPLNSRASGSLPIARAWLPPECLQDVMSPECDVSSLPAQIRSLKMLPGLEEHDKCTLIQ